MNKLKQLSVVLGLVVGFSAMAFAGGLTKPRKTSVVSYTTTPALVHAGAGSVYQVVLSSGAASEFAILVDSGSATGVTSQNTSKLITSRLFYTSASSNTVITFDPPLIYTNGLVVAGSAVTGQAAVTFESGRAIGGQ